MRIRSTILIFSACALWTSGCSLVTMRRPPEDYRPCRELQCSGDAAPAVDTVVAATALAGVIVFSVLADTSDFCDMGEKCTQITPGSAFGLAVGFSALSLAFGLSAYTGYGWSNECGAVEVDHRKWGEAMYPALQVARIDSLRRTKEQQCKELLAEWRKNLSTASLQLKECGRFTKEQRTKRSVMAVTRLQIAVENGETEELKLLLVKHPNKNIKDRRGWTALHSAAQVGNPDAVEVLLQSGLDPNARDKNGAAPLHLAAFAGHVKIIERLAEVADVNARTNSGATPLHAAVLGGNLEATRVLLDNGADADVEDHFGRTPMFYAKIVQEPELEKLFTE